MGIGTIEIVLLVVAIIGTVLAVTITQNKYVLGVIGFFVIAAVCSPPDPLSMLLIAVPSACIYILAIRNRQPHAVE
jgi:Sec-independent protein secretion pathway component TatC